MQKFTRLVVRKFELKVTGLLEDLGDSDIALGPHPEEKTCDRFRLKTIIRLTSTRPATNLYTREGDGAG